MQKSNLEYYQIFFPVFLTLLTGLVACGPNNETEDGTDTGTEDTTDDTSQGDGGSGDENLRGRCAKANRLGGFEVAAFAANSTVQGVVFDGIVPGAVPELISEVDDCDLLRTPNPICDPPCEPGEVCDLDNTCVPYPEQKDVGTVTIEGLNTDIEMTPVVPGNNYFAVNLPHPICDQGSWVELSSTDGFLGILSLTALGVETLEVSDENWTVSTGQGISANWNLPPSDSHSSVLINLSIDQHGASPLRLECEVPDTGHYDIPAEIIDELINGGITGFPSASLMRFTADKMEFDNGCVDLTVHETRTVPVSVE